VDLLEIATELYALTPAAFTASRNDRAKEVKASGDGELAAQVKGLPKPSMAAWVVNMLVRHRADPMRQLLELGASLRRAQADLDGAQLRALNKQRRQLTTAVTHEARSLAASLGHKITDAVATQVEATLHAAMTDEYAEAAVRTGILVEALSATGLGPVDAAGAVAVPSALGELRLQPEPAPSPEPQTKPELSVVRDDTRELEAAERAAAEAESAHAQAERAAHKAEKRLHKLEARALQLEAELEELRRKTGDVEHELEVVEEGLAQAEERRDQAMTASAQAAESAEAARAEVDRLRNR
jgi:hypothetical protein